MKSDHIVIAALLALTSCGNKETYNTEAEENDSLLVVTDSTEQDSVLVDAKTSATYKPNAPTFNGVLAVSPNTSSATVSTTMAGKIHSLKVMQGSAVARGQVVATLDNPEFVELQQEYIDAQLQLDYLKKEYTRQSTLGTQEAASQKKVQQSKMEYLTMKNKTEALATKLKALETDPTTVTIGNIKSYLPVKAPISGFVTDINVNIGKYIETGQDICQIVNKSNPMVELTVYEKDINIINTGDIIDFRINGMGKEIFSAKVISISQTVDKEDYSIKVYAQVTKSNPIFRPGMYIRAKVRK